MSRTFCPLPWMFQAVRNNGDYRICCQANVSEDRGILRHDDGRAANAGLDSPTEARNLQLMKDARRAMLAGEWPKSCSRCQSEEASGLRSRRVYENEIWGQRFDFSKATAVTAADGTLDVARSPLLSYDLRFGNKCNLKCRMCGPTDSDAWYGDHVTLYGDVFHDTHGKVQLEQDRNGHWKAADEGYLWYERGEEFWRSLEETLPTLRHLHIVGGEPLLLNKHYELLEKIVASGHASHVTLEYNTNLTVLPDKVLALWRAFDRVRVGVSLDGVGAVNDYIRHPSKWTVVERNLHRLDQAEGPIDAWISCTVQIYNIFHLPRLIEWKLRSRFKRINCKGNLPLITSHPVHNPAHLNITALPALMKVRVAERFDEFKHGFAGWAPEFAHVDFKILQSKLAELLDGYVRFMNKSDQSQHYAQFLKTTAQLDRMRGESLASVCPELFSLPTLPRELQL